MSARQPEYFDSQAAASAQLKIPLSDLRYAKACGCKAFRSGRVYRKELLKWLAENPSNEPEAKTSSGPELNCTIQDWGERLGMIFAVSEFLDCAYYDQQLSAAEYCRIGDKTIPLLVKLGRVWDAGIDELGYYSRWLSCRRDARARSGTRATPLTCRQSAKK